MITGRVDSQLLIVFLVLAYAHPRCTFSDSVTQVPVPALESRSGRRTWPRTLVPVS